MDVISRYRWRISITTVLIISALVLSLLFALSSRVLTHASGPGSTETLTRLSTDPYTNPSSAHKTEVEPDTFAFGNTIVAAFQVGRFFNGGASNIGWATSTNGGKTFTHGFLPRTTIYATPPGPDKYHRASDPSVAYDARHKVWIISYLAFLNGTSVRVDVLASRSTDGGLTWGSPVPINTSGDFNDKNWTVCDDTATSPFYGHCYTEFDDFTKNNLELMSTSTDGGKTWGAAKSPANHPSVIGGQPLVQPDGTVIVPVEVFKAAFTIATIGAFRSTNGGESWSSTVTVTVQQFHKVDGSLRTSPLPSAEIDRSGKVYVAWEDCRFEPHCRANDIVLTTSTNGITWSPVKRVPIDPIGSGFDHFIPGLAVDRTTAGESAHLALAYYYYPKAECDAFTCQLNVGFISSTNGGESWGGKEHLAGPMKPIWLAPTTQGFMVGDYISTSFTEDGVAFPVFAVAEQPSEGLFHESMFTTAEGVSVVGGNSSSDNDKAVSTSAPGVVPSHDIH